MTNQDHERARRMLALADAAQTTRSDQAWLPAHLEKCESCRVFARESDDVIHALRSIPFAADRALVATTQMHVRQRARELRHRNERVWLAVVSCVAVTVTAALTNFAWWRGLTWLMEHVHISAVTLPVAFAAFWVVPALAVSVLLLAHGTHLADGNERTRS